MEPFLRNFPRKDEAVQEASSRHSEVSLMLSDLDNFKSNVFTECFSIHLSPDSASQATSNIQNIKDSLDAWRDSVKTRLDEIDALCREQRDNLPPEQYSELREARHKLAANYDNVVRTVEGIYGRLNVITVLLLEFSTAASSTQSWITDCTRSAGDIKAKSADAAQFSKQYREAQLLLEKVQGGETRLKEIGGIVRKLEHEIGLLYDESPMGTPRTLNADEVNQTFGRVQSDFETLLKMCQELQQFQNRLSVLEGELMDRSRALDDHLVNVENNLSDFDQSRGMGADSKMKTVVQLQSKARETEPKLDLYEQSTHRLLSHLEGSGAAEDIREAKQADVARAKKRHNSLVGQLQDRMNRVNVELAENEGVKEAVASLLGWTKDFERKLSVPTILPLNEKDLHGLKNDCQLSQSELESRQVVLGQLEKAAERMDGDRLQADLTEAKQRMGKAGILLKGLRDNLNDALAGEQSFTLGCENLSRSCDLLQNSLKTTQPRDTQRLLDCEEDLAGLAGAVDSLESTAGMLKAIPNTSGVEQMDHRVRDFKRRLTELGRDLAAKRSRNSEAANLEKQIQQLRQDTAEWLGNFDGELLELGPVSVDQQRLGQQRRQCSELAEKHRDGLGLMEELEGALALLGEAEGAAGSRNSSVPRHLIDLMTRLNGQADLLRNRLDKINENEKKAAELDEAKRDVEGWIAAQNAAIESLPTPAGKDELQQVNGQIDKIEKSVRQERRKVEDVHLKTRELARRASLPNEAESLLREDEGLESRWNEMQDRVEAKTDRNKRVGQLLDGCGQLEKWLGTKEKMMLALGAPSTEPAVSRSQLAQLQIIKSEAEGEQPTLEALLENAEELAEGDRHAEGLLDRIKTLQRRWKSLDEGLLGKEEAIKTTDGLSHDIKKLQKEIKSRLGEIESSLDTTAHSQSGDIEKQLNSLEDLRLQHKDLNEVVKDLEEKLKQTEEMEIDPANRDEIEEQVQKTKRRVTELGQKIEGTKTAVLTALNEGAAVDEQLNALLAVVRSAAADVQQFPPIVADPSKLAEQLTAVNTLHNGLLTKETEVPVVKALVAKQLKKKHDPELKSKCDELTKAWGPLLVATLDRKSAVEKADDLIKQFTDGEKSLSHRLQDDEKEIEAVVASEEGEAVLQALQAVENVLTRRSADAEGLIGLVDRIEQVAPGPDANKLKRKAENLLDDCKTLSRKAKNAAGESKKRADLRARIERLLSEAKDHASSQENLLKNPENINKERIGPQIAEVADFWTRKRRDLSNCEGEAKEARVDSVLLEEELPKLDIRFENILARLNDHAHSIAEKQSAAQRVVDHAAGEARKVDDLNNEVSDLEPPAHCLEELRGQKEQCQDLIRAVEEERGRVTGAEEEVESAVEDGTISRQQHDSAKSQLDNAEKVLARCQKRLEQRERKIDQAAAEVEDFDRESKELSAELAKLLDPLQAPIEVADLKKQSTELKQLKEAVKPLADRVDAFSSDCKILIKAAGPEAKTTELDEALQRVSAAWSEVSSALADKEMKVDSAAQELGRYEDAYKNLLNWLEDSEELLENQEKPSVDAKAAKLQLATYNLMMKHIEDKEASVSGFNALIDKLVNLAPTEAEKAGLKDKADGISKRYQRLLSEAQDRQARVIDAIDLAERLGEVMTPLAAWLGKTEKRVQALSNIATASAKMEEQLAVQKDLEEEVDQKADDLAVMDSLVPLLSALVSVKDAEELEDQANRLGNSYDGLAQRVHSIRGLLADVANQVGDFEHDTNALAAWLDEMEARLLDVDELAIEPDDLLEQSNILTDLAQAVTERDALVSNVVSVGKVLCKQTTTDEAIALQNRIEVLKNRYVDIMAVADDKLAHLSKAIPLSERFHEGFEVVIQWVEAVEEDLQNIDEADISTQAQLVFTLEEDVQNWRPEVEDLVAVSNQLQALSSRDRAEELYQNTVEMNRRVNQIADKVSRRAERLDVTEKQSRAVLDDLEFIVEWLADAKERLLTADPPSIDPEFLNRQLKNQKIMNEDVTLNKGKLRDVITEAKKIARQIGADAPDSPACAALNEKCDVGKELVDEVSNLCMERTEHLERAKVLAEQLTLEFEELSLWLDNLEDELRTAPDVNTTTPQAELQRMNLHNSELMAAVIAYQPIINTFDKDVKAMVEVCHEKEGEKLRELADELLDRYKEIAEAVRARGHGIDSVMDTTSVFEERLCKLVENLEGAADRLRETGGAMSADPVVLENKLAENAAILENLGSKKAAYSHLKEDAAALLASAPEGDVAAQDVMSKLGRLEKLWADIEQEATLRGELLSDVLGKAKHFWAELDDCQQAVDNLRYRLEAVEPATGQPQQLQLQQQQLASVAADLSSTGPRIAALKQAGDELSSRIPPEEQDVVRTQVDAIQTGWATITNLFADKNRDLIQAMEEAMTFHGDLNDLLGWLDGAEQHLALMPPAESLKIDEIPAALDELRLFKDDVDQHGVLKEQLAQTAAALAEGAPAAQAAVVRQPINELNLRWSKLYGAMAEREHKVEMALLQMGKLSEAAGQLIDWIDRSRATATDLASNSTPRNLRNVEIQICKLAVLKNDVDAHRPSVDTLNAAARRLLKDGSDSTAAGKIDEMNSKWLQLNEQIGDIGIKMDKAKSEAESVGGELERWLSWLDDVEQQLATTRPTGGLPETAQTQMDDFRVLRAEIEQNSPALEEYLKETSIYLLEHGNDQDSWIGRSHNQMKTKWTKVKELCQDREKKLQLALDDAIALDDAMRDTADWLQSAETSLTQLEPVSHVLERAEKQHEELEAWKAEVAKRKQLMAEQQAAGRRLQVYCEKKDAIPIKNGLVSLKHRFEKVQARTNERGKLLAVAMEEARVWLNGVEQVEDCLFRVEEALTMDAPSTSNVDRLKEHLNEVKDLQKAMAETQPYYEVTKKRGSLLAEKSTKPEARQINARNNEMAARWTALTRKCVERQRAAEQAVLEGGAFDEAMKELEDWIDLELHRTELPDYQKVHGDVETVHGLRDEENHRTAERLAKKKGVNTLLKKADELLTKGVDESEAVGRGSERLKEKWSRVEEAAGERDRALSQAESDAADFDAKAHGILDYLAAIEQKLKEPVKDLSLALSQVTAVKGQLDKEMTRRDECLALGKELAGKCHPRAEQSLKHWTRVVDGRWKEVEERCAEREFVLLEEEQKEAERDTQLKELHDFIRRKKDELARMTSSPMAIDLEALEKMEKEYEGLDFDLRERQPDVDNAVKSARKGVNDPRGNQMQNEWKQLWLDSLGYHQALENQRALLEEMKRLEGWKWEQWKDRYVDWNDHGKARVSDLFRRIDRSHTGNVPRNVFIDAIIASRFPTSRLEMDKVADLFDKGDGLINSKEFINALRFDIANRAKPVTDTEKINVEIEKQRNSCSCCNTYRIEKISDNHYKFGDTEIKRMVRILRSTVMVRVGGGWEPLDVFLGKHDPCRANNRTNIKIYKELAPAHAIDTMAAFTKNRSARTSSISTPGPIMKVREKTERSMPMFPRHERAGSDLSSGESKIPRPSLGTSRSSLADSSRPPSRAGSEAGSDSHFQTRIPSLRGKKGSRYMPPPK